MDVDALFAQRVEELGDWRGERLVKLRQIVEKNAPEAKLTWKWGCPVYDLNGLLLSLGSMSDHVKVHFFKGASLNDPTNLFNTGFEAKLTRGIDIFKDDSLDEGALGMLIRNAAKLNAKLK